MMPPWVGAARLGLGLLLAARLAGKPDVAPGWTTLSLQLAGMMFLFSVIFVFQAEYLIQILSANAGASRRPLVVREIASPETRRGARLNIEDGGGAYRLGAPEALLARRRE